MQAASSSLLHGPVARLALACGCVVLGIAAIEIGYRIHTNRPVLVLGDWRVWRIEHRTFGGRAMLDPVLGWTPAQGYVGDGYNTLDHGIRRNFDERTIRAGAILAVGGEFTVGEGVNDDETWPAHLERIAGTPVLNGGVGDYATDQIIMRAEQLMPLARPKTVIVGLHDEDMARAGHSSFGVPRPYFALDKGELKYHPPGPLVADELPRPAWQVKTREILSYSALLDVVLDRLAPSYWHGGAGQQVSRRVDIDTVGVTCALLRRLKTRADSDAIRVLLFMQYAWKTIVETNEPSEDVKKVTACAATMGIDVVDQFSTLRAIAVANRDALGELYLKEDGGGYWSMSPQGNQRAAELLSRALNSKQ